MTWNGVQQWDRASAGLSAASGYLLQSASRYSLQTALPENAELTVSGARAYIADSTSDTRTLAFINGRFVILNPVPDVAFVWPENEPAGLSPVYPGNDVHPGAILDGRHFKFDYTPGGTDIGAAFTFGAKWDGGPRILQTTSAGSKFTNVIRKNFQIGDPSGGNGLAQDVQFSADYETLYFRIVFRLSANWQRHTAEDKLFFFGDESGVNNAFTLTLGVGDGRIVFLNQSSGVGQGPEDDEHIGAWRSSMIPALDEWHTIELEIHAQSNTSTEDGSFKVTWNGDEVTDFVWKPFNDLPIPDPGQDSIKWFSDASGDRLYSGLAFPLFWGGSGDTKTVNDFIDVSEFYLTGLAA